MENAPSSVIMRKKTRRNNVDAGKSQGLHELSEERTNSSCLIVPGSPAAKLKLLVEKQVSRCLRGLAQQAWREPDFRCEIAPCAADQSC